MTDLEQVFSTLLAQIPPLPDDADVDSTSSEINVSIYRAHGQNLTFTVLPNMLTFDMETLGEELADHGKPDSPEMITALSACILKVAAIPESDTWEATADYGYADANFVGTETWEDQAGMTALKTQLQIPDSWYLMKVIRFDAKRLKDIEEWLGDNCMSAFKRVGWSSGCSTKVGIAFENQHDAIMYTLRWK